MMMNHSQTPSYIPPLMISTQSLSPTAPPFLMRTRQLGHPAGDMSFSLKDALTAHAAVCTAPLLALLKLWQFSMASAIVSCLVQHLFICVQITKAAGGF